MTRQEQKRDGEEVMDKPDGGPAFPRYHPHDPVTGVSLRDYFAAAALQRAYIELPDANAAHSMLPPSKKSDAWLQEYADTAAREAYRIADAMLAERDG